MPQPKIAERTNPRTSPIAQPDRQWVVALTARWLSDGNWRPSAFDSDDVRLNLAVSRAGAELPGKRVFCDVGRLCEPRLVARLDLVAQRRALAIGDGRNSRRSRPAARGHCIEARGDEAAARKIPLDRGELMVAVRNSRHEAGRIV